VTTARSTHAFACIFLIHRLRLSLQLQQQQRGRTAVCPPARAAGGDSGGDLDEIMRQDLERFKLKQQQQQQQQQQTQAAPASGSADTKPAGTSGLSEAVDKVRALLQATPTLLWPIRPWLTAANFPPIFCRILFRSC
jgi:hypothetical protein